MILVKNGSIPESVSKYLKSTKVKDMVLVGEKDTIINAVLEDILRLN